MFHFVGQIKIVRVLLDRGALIDVQEKKLTFGTKDIYTGTMLTPLQYACIRDHDDVVELLIEKGATVDLKAIVSLSSMYLY